LVTGLAAQPSSACEVAQQASVGFAATKAAGANSISLSRRHFCGLPTVGSM
jgi:hypothetical protein